MFKFKQYNFRNLNIALIVIVGILCFISAFTINLDGEVNFKRQLFGFALGIVIIAMVTIIDYHFIGRLVPLIYLVVVGLLVLVRFSPLRESHGTGAFRWLDLKVIELQPSELAKIGLILMMAVLLTHLQEKMDKFYTLLFALAIMGAPTILVFSQPDLSSSMVMVFITGIMLFAGGLSYRIILPLLAIAIPSFVALFWYLLQPFQTLLDEYQRQRILGFLDPEQFKQTISYQQNNSVQAISTGKLYGKLLSEGASEVRGYNAVDVTESDFIFSVIGEEYGFLGSCLIILLLAFVIIICLLTARRAKDQLGRLIAIGVSSMFMFQIFANIGVATMILPNTGLPLPFLSYGLSSLMSSMIAIGLILNIGLQQKQR